MDVLRALFDQPGLRSYPYVEVPLNTQLYHVDVPPLEDGSRWQRFIFDKAENLFGFCTDEEIREFRIYVQSRRERSVDYRMKRVVEISKGSTFSGRLVYVFSCADGSVEISGLSGDTQTDIASLSTVWRESRIDE